MMAIIIVIDITLAAITAAPGKKAVHRGFVFFIIIIFF
jgi:hypothetical protein